MTISRTDGNPRVKGSLLWKVCLEALSQPIALVGEKREDDLVKEEKKKVGRWLWSHPAALVHGGEEQPGTRVSGPMQI